MKTKILLCSLLLIGTALAQISIKDASPSDSPLAWSGIPTGLTGKNVAQKEILCYVAKVNSHLTIQKDYYFKPAGLAPGNMGDSFDLTVLQPSFATINAITVTTLYVQFVDGTEWGDHAVGRALTSTRNEINVLLASLTAAYSQGGFSALRATLQKVKDGADYGEMMKSMATQISMLSSDADRLADINSRVASSANHDKTLAGNQQ